MVAKTATFGRMRAIDANLDALLHKLGQLCCDPTGESLTNASGCSLAQIGKNDHSNGSMACTHDNAGRM